MKAVIAVPVVGLLLGAVVGLVVADARHALVTCGLVFAAASFTVLVWRPDRWGTLGALVALSFASGEAMLAVSAWRQAWRPSLRLIFDEMRAGDEALFAIVTGVLASDASVREDGVSLRVAVSAVQIRGRGSGREQETIADPPLRAASGGVLISVAGAPAPDASDAWRAQRTVRLPVRLRRPSSHLNPGLPDEERALARRGVTLVGTVKSAALVEVLARGSPWSEVAAAARAYTRRAVAAHVGRWSPESSAIVTAILIGDRAGLSPTIQQSLQQAGTYHVIAISGGNVAVLAAITLFVFRWAGVLGPSAMLAAVAGFLAYGGVVEGGASVDRAIVTAVLYLLARALDHRVDPLHGLAVAAGFLVVLDPLAVADVGFLLSFGATTGIVLFMPAWRARQFAGLVHAALSLLLATAAAELFLLPVMVLAFERVTLAGLPLNFAAIPAMALTQIAGMALVPVSMASNVAADAIGAVAALGAAALVHSSEVWWVTLVSWRAPRPAPWSIAAYYAGLLVWLATRWATDRDPAVRAVHRAGIGITSAAAVWIAFAPWTFLVSRGDGRLHVVFVDVGQGDAAFVRFPRGGTMLVDAGGGGSVAYDVGDRLVGPVMRRAGVRYLDSLVLTHGDADHIGGAKSVIRDFAPRDVWDGIPVPRLVTLDALRVAASEARTRWTTVQRVDRTIIDDVVVVVHHPAPPDWERQKPRNDDSIVLELRWRDVSIVFAGDIGRATEQEIQGRFEAAPIRVLKVPHHGSRSSSSEEFLRKLRPQVAVVSAGRGNVFGHPAPEVLQRYQSVGAEIFRTDRDGAIALDTDGWTATVGTCRGQSTTYTAR